MNRDLAVGLDAGTTKICAVVAVQERGKTRVIGAGIAPSAGIRKGVIINMDDASDAISKAVREAESSAGSRITSVAAGISGSHVEGVCNAGAISVRGREITASDRDHAVESAGAVYLPLDREMLHLIPAEFILDGRGRIIDPVGMSGDRLESRVCLVTGALNPIRNLMRCAERAGVQVREVVSQPVASARTVLTQKEKKDGVVLVDVGGGTTDIAFFRGGSLRNVAVLGVGGNHLTNDIAVGLKVPVEEAERIKRTQGAAFADCAPAGDMVEIYPSEGQVGSVPRKDLIGIMQARCDEMVQLVGEKIRRFPGSEDAACGVVLTGGVSLLEGFVRMAGMLLDMPVRTGSPLIAAGSRIEGPQFATAVGLAVPEPAAEEEEIAARGVAAGFFARASARAGAVFNLGGLPH